MYRSNFNEVFERVYNTLVFARYTRQRRVSTVVKWAAYIGAFVFVVGMMTISGERLNDLRMTLLTVFWVFFAVPYWRIVSKIGARDMSDAVFHSLLVNVLDGCFDEEVTSCGNGLDRAEYEKSSPEGRYRSFDNTLFESSDYALFVKSASAEITVCEATVIDLNTNGGDGGFDTTSITDMIFAAARFTNGHTPFNMGEVSDKTYVFVCGSTLYIELDGRGLSVGAVTKKAVRRNCRDVCESIERIIEIVGKS